MSHRSKKVWLRIGLVAILGACGVGCFRLWGPAYACDVRSALATGPQSEKALIVSIGGMSRLQGRGAEKGGEDVRDILHDNYGRITWYGAPVPLGDVCCSWIVVLQDWWPLLHRDKRRMFFVLLWKYTKADSGSVTEELVGWYAFPTWGG